MNFAAHKYLLVTATPLLLALPIAAQSSVQVDHRKIIADFQSRTKQYLDLRQRVAGKAPKPNDSAELINAAQRDLGDKLRVARAGAQQGEIFTPAISSYFRRQIAKSLKGAEGKKVRKSLRSAEPVSMELHVNTSYPDNLPFQSTPASLLRKLPQLPKSLEYRILDRELVLRDSEANFIVDYVPDALPDLRK
jgi:hypothetical protein